MAKTLFAFLLATALSIALFPGSAAASTLWAAAGASAAGGTLLSANQDGANDLRQILKRSPSGEGFAWFGLYTTGKNDPGLKAGINEKGLSVISAEASSIPPKSRARQPGKHAVINQILSRFASVDELAANADHVFSGSRAMFLLVADRQQILLAEIGLGGEFVFHSVNEGTLAHTNHYLNKDLAVFNTLSSTSSTVRLARIKTLLKQARQPYTLREFARMSRDRHDGPDNGLWRSGKEHTQSSWIVHSPTNDAPRLRVLIANPGETEKTHEYTLNEAFWKKPALRAAD